ncbi:hypothetical protein HGO23_12855 [Xenorhabdus budapestensis]|uniref:Uncharacterized protein n=1 Tax=Xenorhabdus budapestensis TaxID=290110 RepID=A0ABX7VH31_XENBU|nr:hypothetical protein [Xenorhabdus budapestensis]QTL38765.1 hypothetical protein HGO23_12855 [Xenorhabdus budapestensis]
MKIKTSKYSSVVASCITSSDLMDIELKAFYPKIDSTPDKAVVVRRIKKTSKGYSVYYEQLGRSDGFWSCAPLYKFIKMYPYESGLKS